MMTGSLIDQNDAIGAQNAWPERAEERGAMETRDDGALQRWRLDRWRQTPDTRIAGPEEAAALIDQVGIATLYPASPEIPNLFHAYLGTPDAVTDSGHDSPSGRVYSWRWDLGRARAAFYSSIVRRRPTWVSWALLPAMLRLLAEPRTPDELYDRGVISGEAYRIAQVLESAGALNTSELRREAGFPTGKEWRAAYLKAIEELETRLLLAKVFSPHELDMSHALVTVRYPDHVEAARRMTRQEAVDRYLLTYLPLATYAIPARLTKHMRLPADELRAGLERLVEIGRAQETVVPGERGSIFVWAESE